MIQWYLSVLVFLLVCVTQCCLAVPPINITLNAQELANTSAPSVIVSDTVLIYCTSGQMGYQVYNLNENDFNSCTGNEDKIIGNCFHSPLSINIKTLAMPLTGQVSYEAGNTYYYAAFLTDNFGKISSNQPCLDGLKFSISVTSLDDGSTSSSIMSTASSSYYQSPSMIQPVFSTMINSNSIVMDTVTVQTVAASIDDTITTTTSSDSSRTTVTSSSLRTSIVETTETIRPTIARVESARNTVIIGAGAGGGIAFIVIIVICVLVIVGVAICYIQHKRRRNDSQYYISDSNEKGGTLRPILSSPTHSIPSEFDSTHPVNNGDYNEGQYENISNPSSSPITFQQNDMPYSSQLSTQSEEESIKSTTSMDPLLGPPSPNRLYTTSLNPILELSASYGGHKGNQSEHTNGQGEETDNDGKKLNTLEEKEQSLYTTSSFSRSIDKAKPVSLNNSGKTPPGDNNLLNIQDYDNNPQQYQSTDNNNNGDTRL